MAVAAAVAATAISAAATIGTQAYQASQGGGGKPSPHQFPIPPAGRALQARTARLYAANESNIPPSFGQFIQSGGTATFPWQDPGLTPNEARNLHMVGPQEQAIPFVQPGQKELTDAQKFYLGYIGARQGKMKKPGGETAQQFYRQGVKRGLGSKTGEWYGTGK